MLADVVVDAAGQTEGVGLVPRDLGGKGFDEGGEADVGVLLARVVGQLLGGEAFSRGGAGGTVQVYGRVLGAIR